MGTSSRGVWVVCLRPGRIRWWRIHFLGAFSKSARPGLNSFQVGAINRKKSSLMYKIEILQNLWGLIRNTENVCAMTTSDLHHHVRAQEPTILLKAKNNHRLIGYASVVVFAKNLVIIVIVHRQYFMRLCGFCPSSDPTVAYVKSC